MNNIKLEMLLKEEAIGKVKEIADIMNPFLEEYGKIENTDYIISENSIFSPPPKPIEYFPISGLNPSIIGDQFNKNKLPPVIRKLKIKFTIIYKEYSNYRFNTIENMFNALKTYCNNCNFNNPVCVNIENKYMRNESATYESIIIIDFSKKLDSDEIKKYEDLCE